MSELEEFVVRFNNFDGLQAAYQNEILAFYLTNIRSAQSFTASQIDELRQDLRLPKFRTAQDLSERSKASRRGTEPVFMKRAHGYTLSRVALKKMSTMFGERPSATKVSTELRNLIGRVPSEVARSYLDEARGCFEAGFRRASVILAWCVVYDSLRQSLFDKHRVAINTQMSAWKKPKQIQTIDDFDDLSERTVIDTAREVKVLTREQHKALVSLLDRRNSHAHPTTRPLSESATEAYLEEAIRDIAARHS